jgi:hypothetical protein
MQSIRLSLKSGLPAGFFGMILSFLANYYLIEQPETLLDIAIGNGVTGFISGFMGGFLGLLIYLKTENPKN